MAEAADVHAPDISNYERGVQEPAFTVLLRLATALKVELNAFAPKAGDQPGDDRPTKG